MFHLQCNFSCVDGLGWSPWMVMDGFHNILLNVYSVLSDRLYHFASGQWGVFLLMWEGT